MLQKHSNKLDLLWYHSMALSAWQPHCYPNSHMQSSKGAQSLSSYTRLHSRLATHTTQSIIRHSFLSNQQWLGSWIKYHFSNKSQVGKLIPSCQATHDLDSTSADTSCLNLLHVSSNKCPIRWISVQSILHHQLRDTRTHNKTIVSSTENGWSNLLTNPRYLTLFAPLTPINVSTLFV